MAWFSVAEVMVVSMVAVLGRALVMAVSCWPASVAAEVSLVLMLPSHSSLCAKKFALLGPAWTRARKSSPSARKTPQIRRICLSRANFVSHKARYASCWAKNVSPTGAAIRLAAHAATSTPTARLECAVKLVARGYCTTWGPLHCFVASAMLRYLVHCLPK